MMNPLAAAIAGLTLLLCGSVAAPAQTLTNTGKPTATRSSHKAPKPATAQPVATPSYDSEPGRLSDYWTIEKALPDRPSERVRRARDADNTPGVQRVPLQDSPGSLGVASGNVRSSEFYDGRPIPGITQNSYNNSSYVGMSVSVPSDSNRFFLPAPPFGSSQGW